MAATTAMRLDPKFRGIAFGSGGFCEVAQHRNAGPSPKRDLFEVGLN
jgi:hypothetical protein